MALQDSTLGWSYGAAPSEPRHQALLRGQAEPADDALNAIEAHSDTTVMVGDRVDTDVVSGPEEGMRKVLVLTGITTRADAE